MCVDKIEYFYPLENDNFTFVFHGNFNQADKVNMKVAFNYGLYNVVTSNIDQDYSTRLTISVDNGGSLEMIKSLDYCFIAEDVKFVNKSVSSGIERGCAYFSMEMDNLLLRKGAYYKAELNLLNSKGEVVDTSNCYFNVLGD